MSGGQIAVFGITLWTTALMMSAVVPRFALATHEADHRFIVYGYVRDEGGVPLKDQKVIVVDIRLDQGITTFTDREGYYEALLHLHNEDLGDEITVMTGDQKKSIRVTFDPDDKHTERRTQVDFGAALSVEPSSSLRGYGIAVLVAAGVALTLGALRYRKRSAKKPSKGSKKAK